VIRAGLELHLAGKPWKPRRKATKGSLVQQGGFCVSIGVFWSCCIHAVGEMWQHDVSSSLRSLHSCGVEFAVRGRGCFSCRLEDKGMGSSWPLWSTWVGGERTLGFSRTFTTFC